MDIPYRGRIITSDNQEIGVVRELVIEPRSRIITHLVVQKGLFFARDRLIATELIDRVSDNRVFLKVRAAEIDENRTDEYREGEYVPLRENEQQELTDDEQLRVWVRPLDATTADAPYQSVVPPGIGPLVPEREPAIPLDEITLDQGSLVRSSDGTEIGSVDECRTDNADKLTHVLIKEGVFFTVPKLIPVDWIQQIKDNEIILSVNAETVASLPAT